MNDMKESKIKKRFFECECHSEGMLVSKWDDEEQVNFSFWKQGMNPINMTWRDRMRLIWKILYDGQIYDDEVILSDIETKKLIGWLKEIVRERN